MLVKLSCCSFITNKKNITIKIVKGNKKYLCPFCGCANSKYGVLEVGKKIILNPNNI